MTGAASAPSSRGSRPLRVLLVGPVAPPFGGMSVQGDLLARRLASSGVVVSRLPTNPNLGWVARVRFLRAVVGHAMFLALLLRGALRTDVIHILGASWFYFLSRVVPSVIVGRCFGRRVVLNYRGGEADAFFARHGAWARPVARMANVVTVPSGFLRRVFARYGIASTEVPNIADLDRFRFRARSRLEPRLIVTRQFSETYNIALAIDAFARIKRVRPDATLTLAGEGPLEQSLRAHVSRHGLEGITFHGRVDNAGMAELYETHDICLNPTNVDNTPITLLECMAAGLAVVSTNVGGIPDLVNDRQHCLLVPPRDPEAMAAAVLTLLDDGELARRLIEGGRRNAARFGWESVWPTLKAVYGGQSP